MKQYNFTSNTDNVQYIFMTHVFPTHLYKHIFQQLCLISTVLYHRLNVQGCYVSNSFLKVASKVDMFVNI